MKQSAFADLPAELLFSIFDHSESEDLINVAQSCRRLNLMALPFVMERAGFPEPEKIYVVKLARRVHCDELAPLILKFSLNTMDKFSCVLFEKRSRALVGQLEDPASQISDFTHNIRRVNRLISRLSSIGSVTLIIASQGSPWFTRRDVVQPFADAVLDMMKVSIQRSCIAFQILHCHPGTVSIHTPYKFELVNGVQVKNLGHSLAKRLFPSLAEGYLHGDGWKYRKVRPPNAVPQLTFSIPMKSNLTNFDINCDLLLVPPFSTWTFALMKSSPITELTLSVPDFVTEEELQHYILPNVTASLPKLQGIRLAFHRSLILAIVEKLPFFPLLQRVTFALPSFTGSFSEAPAKLLTEIELPLLVSFTGSADQAAYLFRNSAVSPNLQFVNIIIDYNTEPGYGLLARSFSNLDGAFPRGSVTPCISVCLTNYGHLPDTWTTIEAVRDHYAQPFKYVSRLTLDLPRFAVETSEDFSKQIYAAIAWIDMFRGLKHLTVTLIDSMSIETRRKMMIAAVNAEFPAIEISTNVVNLSNPRNNRSHYHWSNVQDSWVRGTSEIPTMPFFLPPTPSSYMCSHF